MCCAVEVAPPLRDHCQTGDSCLYVGSHMIHCEIIFQDLPEALKLSILQHSKSLEVRYWKRVSTQTGVLIKSVIMDVSLRVLFLDEIDIGTSDHILLVHSILHRRITIV